MLVHDFDEIIDRRGSDSVKWNVHPQDVLPLWVADSDFRAPEPLVKALEARTAHGLFGYSDWRDESWKNAVVHWMQSRFAWEVAPDSIAFSPSVVASLALCVTTFTVPGENVLFLTPSYPPFFSIPAAHGRKTITSSLTWKNGRYRLDFADIENKMADSKTRLFILCNPHNPTGKVFSREELHTLGELCLRHNLLIFSDEIHGDYVFPGRKHIPFPSLSAAIAMRTLVAVNPSKTFNIADLHCSAVLCANPNLLERFERALSGLGLHSSALGLLALKTAYQECAWYADQAAAYIKGNIDQAVAFINERVPGVHAAAPEATFLLWLDCRDLGLSQKELERFFLRQALLALNSGSDFGPEGEGYMRMNLACPRATLNEALLRLERAVSARGEEGHA